MKQKIVRADGLEYERKPKEKKYNKSIYVKIDEKTLEKFKDKVKENEDNCSNIIRNAIEKYIGGKNER